MEQNKIKVNFIRKFFHYIKTLGINNFECYSIDHQSFVLEDALKNSKIPCTVWKKIQIFFIKLLRIKKKKKLEDIVKEVMPKTVDIKDVTNEDINNLSRRETHVDAKDMKEQFEKFGNVQFQKTLVNIIRNKKTGRVMMIAGNAESLKAQYGDDYELVEASIKE